MLPQQHNVLMAQQWTVGESLHCSMVPRNFLNPGLGFSLEMVMMYYHFTAIEMTLC